LYLPRRTLRERKICVSLDNYCLVPRLSIYRSVLGGEVQIQTHTHTHTHTHNTWSEWRIHRQPTRAAACYRAETKTQHRRRRGLLPLLLLVLLFLLLPARDHHRRLFTRRPPTPCPLARPPYQCQCRQHHQHRTRYRTCTIRRRRTTVRMLRRCRLFLLRRAACRSMSRTCRCPARSARRSCCFCLAFGREMPRQARRGWGAQ
jgi:hypothetical protein